MAMIKRRGFIAGLGALLAAPAIIRTPGLLMPVKPVVVGPAVLTVAAWARMSEAYLVHLVADLEQQNEIFDALVYGTSMTRFSVAGGEMVRTSLPQATWRKLYETKVA